MKVHRCKAIILKRSYLPKKRGGGGQVTKTTVFQYTTKKEGGNKCLSFLLCTLSTMGKARSSEYRIVAKGTEVMC